MCVREIGFIYSFSYRGVPNWWLVSDGGWTTAGHGIKMELSMGVIPRHKGDLGGCPRVAFEQYHKCTTIPLG